MAKVAVKYKATFVQVIDWPDDEIEDFTYENLESNIDPVESQFTGDLEIDKVELNDEGYWL